VPGPSGLMERTLRSEDKGQAQACPDRTRAIPCTVRIGRRRLTMDVVKQGDGGGVQEVYKREFE
jgi:hypothetical protein